MLVLEHDSGHRVIRTRSDFFVDHPDGATRAFGRAHSAAFAEIEIHAKPLSRTLFHDGIVGANAVAVVAFEAVAARQAAPGFEQGVFRVEAGVHFGERRAAPTALERRLNRTIGILRGLWQLSRYPGLPGRAGELET